MQARHINLLDFAIRLDLIFLLFEQELDSEISTWKALNACRSVGVILGWLLISFRPNTDLLYKHIKKLGIYRADQLGSSTLKL